MGLIGVSAESECCELYAFSIDDYQNVLFAPLTFYVSLRARELLGIKFT